MAVWAKLGLLLGFSIAILGSQGNSKTLHGADEDFKIRIMNFHSCPGSKFTPAAPGETPKCAKKGKSFCEYVAGYPS